MTNHADQAQLSLIAAWQSRGDGNESIFLAEAQVHATLELAKQARIANVIEMSRWVHETGAGVRLSTNGESSEKWRAEAAEALGLS